MKKILFVFTSLVLVCLSAMGASAKTQRPQITSSIVQVRVFHDQGTTAQGPGIFYYEKGVILTSADLVTNPHTGKTVGMPFICPLEAGSLIPNCHYAGKVIMVNKEKHFAAIQMDTEKDLLDEKPLELLTYQDVLDLKIPFTKEPNTSHNLAVVLYRFDHHNELEGSILTATRGFVYDTIDDSGQFDINSEIGLEAINDWVLDDSSQFGGPATFDSSYLNALVFDKNGEWMGIVNQVDVKENGKTKLVARYSRDIAIDIMRSSMGDAKQLNLQNTLKPESVMSLNTSASVFVSSQKEEGQSIDYPTQDKFQIFPDLPLDHPKMRAIYDLRQRGIIGGYADGTFGPKNSLTRAELLKIAMEAKGIPLDATNVNCFGDVSPRAWETPYVCKAKAMGIIEGFADGTFRSATPVNRVESLKMMIETLGIRVIKPLKLIESEPDIFSDVVADEWYAKYVNTAEIVGILDEYKANKTYGPGGEVSRQEASDNLYQFLFMRDVADGDIDKMLYNLAATTVLCHQDYYGVSSNSSEFSKLSEGIYTYFGFADKEERMGLVKKYKNDENFLYHLNNRTCSFMPKQKPEGPLREVPEKLPNVREALN
jgi:hypothetical protein